MVWAVVNEEKVSSVPFIVIRKNVTLADQS
jgi:hypothetical protein